MISRKTPRIIKISWLEYIFSYCIPSGFNRIYSSFLNWMDLVWFEDNQKRYKLLHDDDGFKSCSLNFWYDLGEEPYEKELLEYIYTLENQIENNEFDYIPFTENMMSEIETLIGSEDNL